MEQKLKEKERFNFGINGITKIIIAHPQNRASNRSKNCKQNRTLQMGCANGPTDWAAD